MKRSNKLWMMQRNKANDNYLQEDEPGAGRRYCSKEVSIRMRIMKKKYGSGVI